MSAVTGTNTEEKQLPVDTKDEKPVSTNDEQNGTVEKETEEPASFELADQYYMKSVDALKANEMFGAIDNAAQAVEISETASGDDVNNIKLAKYFLQYGKCLLTKLQQTKELLAADGDEDAEMNDIENIEEKENESETPNENENGTKENESKENDNNKTTSNGKSEIDDDDEEQDIDVENVENTNNTNNDEKTDDKDVNDNDNDNDNNDVGDEANEYEEDDREHCWTMLETGRFIIAKHLESLGVDVEKIITLETEDSNEANNENDENNKVDANESKTTETKEETTNTENVNKITSKENEDEEEEEEEDIDIEPQNNKNESKENTDNNNSEENKSYDEESMKYLFELSEVYTLLGDHQLEDNSFDLALDSYEKSLQLKTECNESNRELAFSHYMAALAASHAREYDIMEMHCVEAIDLLNDRILTLIDSFENEKYQKATSSEDLDEARLVELVKEFETEYKGKLESLTDKEKKNLDEIGEMMILMKEIQDKVENDLNDARKLEEIEELQGESIKELVMKMMAGGATGQNDENSNENSNENTNDNGKSNENNNDNNNSVNVGGITFGSFGGNDENKNTNEMVNTLNVQSRRSKKRSLEAAGLNEEVSPFKRLKIDSKAISNKETKVPAVAPVSAENNGK